MTLFRIVTDAPVAPGPGVGGAEGVIAIPPPAATSWPGNALLTPPVTVTPVIVIVGRFGLHGNGAPIRITGPPPLMIVDDAPAPTRSTLTLTVTPPAYVPGRIRMVSP